MQADGGTTQAPISAGEAPTFFISDLHLDASRTRITEALRHFLEEIACDAQAVYILGDLFDSWIGDDHNDRYIRSIKKLLADACKNGVTIYFMHGNRDFLIGDGFAADTGAVLLAENTVVDLYGEQVLLLHGDALCTDDQAYQEFRQRVRTPEWRRKILAKPLFVRRLIAAYLRFKSRRANRGKTETIMDVTPQAVIDTFERFKVKKMIHGHTHRPKRHRVQLADADGERIVLGDWGTESWYLRADSTGQELVAFSQT